jgi:hypothetical protein
LHIQNERISAPIQIAGFFPASMLAWIAEPAEFYIDFYYAILIYTVLNSTRFSAAPMKLPFGAKLRKAGRV